MWICAFYICSPCVSITECVALQIEVKSINKKKSEKKNCKAQATKMLDNHTASTLFSIIQLFLKKTFSVNLNKQMYTEFACVNNFKYDTKIHFCINIKYHV